MGTRTLMSFRARSRNLIKIVASGFTLLAMAILLSIPVYAATTTTNRIKINIYDSTSLNTMMETCDQIKQDQEQNHTYTDESYEKLMEACEEGLGMLDCLENAGQNNADASECGNLDEEKDNIEDAINELETAPTNPTNPNNPTKPLPPNTGTWSIKLFNTTYQLPILPFIMLSFATLLTIGLVVYLIRKRIMEKGIGGIRIKSPWGKDSYERIYESKLVKKHQDDPLTEIIDVSQIIRKYRIKFVLWHTIPVSAIILAFFVFLFATAPIKAQNLTSLPTLDETAIAPIATTIINIDKKNETADPIEKTATITTTVTTENETGYTLSAKLNTDQDTTDALSVGITAELNAETLTTAATEIYASNDDTSPDTQNHALFVTAPAGAANGVYTLSVEYEVGDNEPPFVASPFSCAPNGYHNDSTWTRRDGTDHGHIGAMQNVTSASTASWNVGDYATVTDIRNDQDYVICKLPDEHVWMINNLRLGSTSSATPLTPADSNITSNWDLPIVGATTSNDYNIPRVYGPVPGSTDDITDETFYGYLYNWCAATAGGTASGGSNTCTSQYVALEDATGDICPANWRLPADDSAGEFAWLNARMRDPNALSPSTDSGLRAYQNWHFIGAWRGVTAGSWDDGSPEYQGRSGVWWTSIHNHGYTIYVVILAINPSSASPGSVASLRNRGYSVRCILKY